MGVPNFLLSVINTLSIERKDWTIYLLSNEDFNHEVKARLIHPDNVISMVSSPWPFNRIAILWYVLKLPFLIRILQPDIFYSPIPNLPPWLPKKVRTFITIHDMVYKHLPKTMSATNWWINFFLHDRSIRQADLLWAVSEYTKREINFFFPSRRSDSILVGSSVDKSVFHPTIVPKEKKEQLLARYDLQEKFILFVGTQEPRKNISFLISLAPALVQHGYSLLIVGTQGWGNEPLQPENSVGESAHIRFSGFIPNEELAQLYRLAAVYVSTALNEGFGLPQLEAMCCGCPVVSPHNSAMIEVVEGAGETVQGWNVEEWIAVILQVATNREYYASRGFERAKIYNWESVISKMTKYVDSNFRIEPELPKTRATPNP